MAFPYLLLAAQAAGMATNIFAQSRQNKISGLGLRLDESMIKQRMEQETLAATQETLADLTNLQETLASQRAILGARGQLASQGSAKSLEQKSIRAFGAEEQAKRINQTFRKSYLDSINRLKRVENQGLKAQRATQLLGQSLNMVDFNSLYGLFDKTPKTTKVK